MRTFLFSEEGRAVRNGRRFMLAVAVLLLILSVIAGYFTFTLHTKNNMTALQRVYLPRYYHSAWRSYLTPFDPKSNYWLLIRIVADPKTKKETVLLCLDHEVNAIFDDDGKIQSTKDGFPDIRIKPYYFEQSKRFLWDRRTLNDGVAYAMLRQRIFEGKEIYQLCYPSLLSGFFIFFPGMIGASIFRRRLTRQYLRGRFIRGTRELTSREYARAHRRDDGLGLEVYSPEQGG